MKKYLYVRVQNPQEVLWEGEARSVSSANTEGPFDILYQHANFITWIEDAEVKIISKDKEKIKYDFERSVLYVRNNYVSVYTF